MGMVTCPETHPIARKNAATTFMLAGYHRQTIRHAFPSRQILRQFKTPIQGSLDRPLNGISQVSMKRSWLPHAAWALVATLTFLLGAKLNWLPDDEKASDDKPSPTRSLRSSREPGDRRQTGATPRGRNRADDPSSAGENFHSQADLAALGEAFKSGNLVERRLAFAEILKKITPENARELRELVADLPQDSPEFREFHYAWGAVAGQDAVTHGKDTPKKDMAAALAGWASKDPSAALTYFDSLTPAEQNNAAHLKWGAAFGLADADPSLAADFARIRAEGGDKDAPHMINIAAAAILRTNDPAEAASWASDIPEGPLQNAAFRHLAGEYAKKDPNQAVAWATDLPVGEGRDYAVGTSFHNWANQDAREAANAIEKLPAEVRDAATYGYATSVVHKDPAIGVEWAANIQDPEKRNRALVDTGRVFYKRDQETARQWLADSGLPESTIREITDAK
jgi:hypothetical protein